MPLSFDCIVRVLRRVCSLRYLCCSSSLSNPPTSPMWIQSLAHIEVTFIDSYSYGSPLSPIPRVSACSSSSFSHPLPSIPPPLPPYLNPSNQSTPPLVSPPPLSPSPPHFYPFQFLLFLRNSNGTDIHKMSLKHQKLLLIRMLITLSL